MTPSIPKPIQSQERIEIRNIVIFIVMAFGMFMAILDIQIVASSLAEVQAGLAASSEEISWVQTSYLIAEVIMLPLSGFLGRLLSTRVFFTISAIGFTVTSILCATAASIGEMIIYRALQGFIGGGIIPSVFVASYVLFLLPNVQLSSLLLDSSQHSPHDWSNGRRLPLSSLIMALAFSHQCAFWNYYFNSRVEID